MSNKQDKLYTDSIRRAVCQETYIGSGVRKIQAIADMLVELAVHGDLQAIKEVGDRLEGRPLQRQAVGVDEEAGPLQIVIRQMVRLDGTPLIEERKPRRGELVATRLEDLRGGRSDDGGGE